MEEMDISDGSRRNISRNFWEDPENKKKKL